MCAPKRETGLVQSQCISIKSRLISKYILFRYLDTLDGDSKASRLYQDLYDAQRAPISVSYKTLVNHT